MKKLESLSEEQKQMMNTIKNKWINHFNECHPINQDKSKELVSYIYELSNLKKPEFIFVKSPFGAQLVANFLEKNGGLHSVGASVRASVGDSVWASVRASVGASVGDSVWASVGASVRASVRDSVWASVRASVRASVGDSVWASVRASVRASVGASVRASVWASVGASVGDSVRASVRASVWASVRASVGDSVGASKLKYYDFNYGSCSDYGWVAFYDFFVQIGHTKHEKFNKFSKLLFESNIYDLITLDKIAIIVENPIEFHRGQLGRLHCEDGAAIKFADGYELHYWKGTKVDKRWIEQPNTITKEEIINEKNAEKRRCLRDILGAEKYFNILGGVNLIDEDVDEQGNLMQLFETKKNDEVINKKIQFLQVICPSTERQYVLYPPNQQSSNVWAAKASTFRDKKVQYRHGDVALINLNKEYKKPLIET